MRPSSWSAICAATCCRRSPSLRDATALVGGGPAEAVDFTDMLATSFPYLMVAVLVITYFVLLLLFRSVILPLKAIFMNLLSVSAAFGVLVLVFQDGWGESLLGFNTQPAASSPLCRSSFFPCSSASAWITRCFCFRA